VRYVKAVPILVDALSAVTDKKTLMEVIRALSVPWARPIATAPLIDAFRRVDDPSGLGLRWAAGNALDITWDDVCFDELASLARDRSFGRAREMVVLGLARSKRPEVGDILVGLLNDPDVSGHATKALSKRAVPQAREGLVRMTADSRAWVRKAAADALRKLDQGL
jgi:HEAT repeat protein